MLLLALFACKDEPDADIPPGLDPLEDNAVALPDSETVNFASNDDEAYVETHARGRIDAAIDAVTACLSEPEVGVDRRRVAEWSATLDTDPTYTVSYDVDTLVQDVIDIQYIISWQQGDRGDGTYGTRWQKTEGDDLLELLEGSVLLQPIDNAATDVGIIERIEALLTTTEDTEQFTGDFYASLKACAHGEALPTY